MTDLTLSPPPVLGACRGGPTILLTDAGDTKSYIVCEKCGVAGMLDPMEDQTLVFLMACKGPSEE